MKRRLPGSQPGIEERKVPPAGARQRARVAVTLALAGLAAIWIVPAVVVGPVTDPAAIAFPVGFAVGLGLALVRGMCNARGSRRLSSASARFLTAKTWTGSRTIDLRDLRRIRARRIAGRMGSVDYLIVTDGAGVSIAFSDQTDIRLVRRMLDEAAHQTQQVPSAKVSRLARGVLGISPLPHGASAIWSLASAELPLLISLTCAFAIMPIAAK